MGDMADWEIDHELAHQIDEALGEDPFEPIPALTFPGKPRRKKRFRKSRDRRRPLTKFEHEVFETLKVAKLEPYIHVVAASGSCYIKFHYKEMRSLRIGDHGGYSKYRYKWNLRDDIDEYKKVFDKGVVRYFYPFEELLVMVSDMIEFLREKDCDFTNRPPPKNPDAYVKYFDTETYAAEEGFEDFNEALKDYDNWKERTQTNE